SQRSIIIVLALVIIVLALVITVPVVVAVAPVPGTIIAVRVVAVRNAVTPISIAVRTMAIGVRIVAVSAVHRIAEDKGAVAIPVIMVVAMTCVGWRRDQRDRRCCKNEWLEHRTRLFNLSRG